MCVFVRKLQSLQIKTQMFLIQVYSLVLFQNIIIHKIFKFLIISDGLWLTCKQPCPLLIQTENSSFSVARPVNGWHRGKTHKNRSSPFCDGNKYFPWDPGSAHPWRYCWMYCWKKKVLSCIVKRANEDCYPFPVQQLHSSLVTWIPLCFGYASACVPRYTNTHKNKAVMFYYHIISPKRHLTIK